MTDHERSQRERAAHDLAVRALKVVLSYVAAQPPNAFSRINVIVRNALADIRGLSS